MQIGKKLETIIVGAFAVIYGTLMIIYSKEAAEAVKQSINTCLTAIIPSLFAFMALSSFFIKTGLYKVLSKPFRGFSRRVMRIPPPLFSVFLLSGIAGYPIGAKLLSDLYKNGAADKDTCASMQCFCYMGGPAYFCGIVSVTLYESITPGLLILAITLIVNFTVALLSAKTRPVPPDLPIFCKTDISVKNFLSAVSDGGVSVLIMCGIIIFFATFTCLLRELGFIGISGEVLSTLFGMTPRDAEVAVLSIIEINNVRQFTPGSIALLPMICALLTFGGICVVLQMYQFAQDYIKTGLFFVYRFFGAAMAYALTAAAIRFLPVIAPASANISADVTKGSVTPSVCLFIMLILLFCSEIPDFLYQIKRRAFSDKRNS